MNINHIELTPFITVIIEGLKRMGMPSKYAIPVSWVLGVAISVFYTSGDYFMDVINGVVLGATSTGLYEGVKTSKNYINR